LVKDQEWAKIYAVGAKAFLGIVAGAQRCPMFFQRYHSEAQSGLW